MRPENSKPQTHPNYQISEKMRESGNFYADLTKLFFNAVQMTCI